MSDKIQQTICENNQPHHRQQTMMSSITRRFY